MVDNQVVLGIQAGSENIQQENMDEEPAEGDLRALHGHKSAILCCHVHGNCIITAGHDKKIVIWDALSGRIKLEIIGHEHMISDVDVHAGTGREPTKAAEESYILSASWDMSVKVWYLRTGSSVCKFTGHKNRVRKVKALSDVNANVTARAVSGDDDGVMYVWNMATGHALLFLDEHTRFITTLVAYSDDAGMYKIASGSADGTVRLWDVTTTAEEKTATQSTAESKGNENGRHRRGVTAPSGSSMCVLRTPSKYISAMTVAAISSACPLIKHTTNTSGAKASLPPISPTKNTQLNTTPHTDWPYVSSAIETNKKETVVVAGDTLGSIFIYRESSGTLLVQLETKCKIVDLFISAASQNIPYFPSELERTSLSPAVSPTAAAEQWQSPYISTERAQLLAQAAHMRRSNHIVTAITGTGQRTAADGSIQDGLLLCYVPDNGSVGCFTLVPAGCQGAQGSAAGSPKQGAFTGMSAIGSSAAEAVNALLSSHVVSTALCQQMAATVAALKKGSDSGRTGFHANDGGSGIKPRREGSTATLNISSNFSSGASNSGANNNTDDKLATFSLSDKYQSDESLDMSASNTPTAGSIRKLSSTGSSATERHLPTVNAATVSAKLRKHSTYNGGLSEKDFEEDAGSVVTSSAWSAKDSHRINSSTRPRGAGAGSGMGGLNAAATTGGANRGSSRLTPAPLERQQSGAKGAVVSVSISTAEPTDYPLLQCFAMSPAAEAGQTRRYMIFGARDGTLLYCTYRAAPTYVPADDKAQRAEVRHPAVSSAGPLNTGKLGPINTQSASMKALPPLKTSPQSNRLSPVHFNPAQFSPTAADEGSVSGKAPARSGRYTRSVAPAREKIDSHSIRKAAMLGTDNEDAASAGLSESYHIGKCSSGDLADTVTQSEVSHLMHYYDDLFCDPTSGKHTTTAHGEGGPPRQAQPGDESGTLTLMQSLSADFAQMGGTIAGEKVADGQATATGDLAGSNINANGGGAASVRSHDSAGSEFASIVTNSTLNPEFWQAAHTAKTTYNFRRIRPQQGKQPLSPSKSAALYQLSEAPSSGYAYATGNYPGHGQNSSLSRSLLNSRVPQQHTHSPVHAQPTLHSSSSDATLTGSGPISPLRAFAGAGDPVAGAKGGQGLRPVTTVTASRSVSMRAQQVQERRRQQQQGQHRGQGTGTVVKHREGAEGAQQQLMHSSTAQNRNASRLSHL
jgi:hypothetical protein